MGFCIECGTDQGHRTKYCPTCGTQKAWEFYASNRDEVIPAAPASVIEPEMMIARAHLMAGPVELAGSSDAPTVTASPRHNGLAASALVIGTVSALLALQGHGWFGTLAAIHGHRARRQIVERRGAQVGSGLALTGLLLGYMAIALTLVDLGNNLLER